MPLKLVSEEEMTRSKKVEKKSDIKIIKEKIVKPIELLKEEMGIIEEKEKDFEIIEYEKKKEKREIKIIEEKGMEEEGEEEEFMIIKKIYFPRATYSDNQAEYKKILAKYGLVWVRNKMKEYTNKEGKSITTGIYSTAEGDKKVFCIYEGSRKPATMIVKTAGSGGNFLIDLNSFSHNVGCTIEDKDKIYVDNIMLKLKEGEIYLEESEKKKYEEMNIAEKEIFEEKVERNIQKEVEKFIEAQKFCYDTYCTCLLWLRGISINFMRKYRRMEIEKNVIWAVERGFLE